MTDETADRAVPTERQVTGARTDVPLPEARVDGEQASLEEVGDR